jgi:hypothetical protein
MLLPVRFATSPRLDRVGLNRLGRGRVELVKHRVAALRDLDEARLAAAVSPVIEAVAPVARSMQRQAGNHRGRTTAAVAAVAVTAAVATVAYVWWRRQDQRQLQPEGLYLGPRSWAPVPGVSSRLEDEGGASHAAVMGAPSEPLVTAVGVDAPVAADDLVHSDVHSEESAVEAAEAQQETSELAAAEVQVAPEDEGSALDTTDDVAVAEETPAVTVEASEAAAAPRASEAVTRGAQPPSVDAVSNSPASSPTTEQSEHEAARQPAVESATARRQPQTTARATPPPAGQALTQPPFPVPSSRPRLPGGWRSPLP